MSGIPTDMAPQATLAYVFDTLARYLPLGIRLVFVVALLVALGTWVSGPPQRPQVTALLTRGFHSRGSDGLTAPHLSAPPPSCGGGARFGEGEVGPIRLDISTPLPTARRPARPALKSSESKGRQALVRWKPGGVEMELCLEDDPARVSSI